MAALGLAAATLRGGMALFYATLPPSIAALMRVVPLDFDRRVFLFALLRGLWRDAAVRAGARASGDATEPDARAAWPARARATRAATLRNGLVASQVAVSLVLLVRAVTLARNGVAVGATDFGSGPPASSR